MHPVLVHHILTPIVDRGCYLRRHHGLSTMATTSDGRQSCVKLCTTYTSVPTTSDAALSPRKGKRRHMLPLQPNITKSSNWIHTGQDGFACLVVSLHGLRLVLLLVYCFSYLPRLLSSCEAGEGLQMVVEASRLDQRCGDQETWRGCGNGWLAANVHGDRKRKREKLCIASSPYSICSTLSSCVSIISRPPSPPLPIHRLGLRGERGCCREDGADRGAPIRSMHTENPQMLHTLFTSTLCYLHLYNVTHCPTIWEATK